MEYDDNAEFEDMLYDDEEDKDEFEDGFEEIDYTDLALEQDFELDGF